MIARRARLIGRVQGVFFRAWTREQAQELGVAGWVRNCSDGSVETQLEGEEAVVEELIERMRQGPSGAQVDELKVEAAAPEGLNSFQVRR
jgi:acylphosphatase